MDFSGPALCSHLRKKPNNCLHTSDNKSVVLETLQKKNNKEIEKRNILELGFCFFFSDNKNQKRSLQRRKKILKVAKKILKVAKNLLKVAKKILKVPNNQ